MQSKQQQQQQKFKKPGLYDQMWQALIRPPNRFIYQTKDLGPENFIVDKVRGTRTDFTIKNSRNNILECSYFAARSLQNQPHPCVIYLHGNSSSRIEGLTLLEYLVPFGIAVILMDFAGCGVSQGEYISLGYFEKFDAGIVMDYIKQTKNITSFGIWGRSMGASTGIQVGGMRPDVGLVVADSSFVSIQKLCQEIAKGRYKLPKFALSLAFFFIKRKIKKIADFDLNNCNTLLSLQKSEHKPPILFLAAKGDQLIHYQHSIELFENYKGPKNILLFEGNHNSKRQKNILLEVSKYFRENLIKGEKLIQIENISNNNSYMEQRIPTEQQNEKYLSHKQSLDLNNLVSKTEFIPIPAKIQKDEFIPQNNSSDSSDSKDKIPEEKKDDEGNVQDISSYIKTNSQKENIFLSNYMEKQIFLERSNSMSDTLKGGSTSISDVGYQENN